MRYEKELDAIDKDPKKLKGLMKEYDGILKRLGDVLEADESYVL